MGKFIVKSSDSYNEKNYEMVKGELILEGDKQIYTYDSKLGKCRLEVAHEKVIISREGQVNTKIEVELNKKTKFLYRSSGFTKELFVLGESIKIDKNLLEVSYKLLDGNEELNTVKISIKSY